MPMKGWYKTYRSQGVCINCPNPAPRRSRCERCAAKRRKPQPGSQIAFDFDQASPEPKPKAPKSRRKRGLPRRDQWGSVIMRYEMPRW